MLLLYCDVRGISEKNSRCKARSGRSGSAFGTSLLAYALERGYGIAELPEIIEDSGGKPIFRDFPQLHFSVSHSAGHILCAVADFPVGADIERHREMRERTIAKLMSAEEARDFSFFELWTLRESFYKLTGHGDMRSLRFRRENGEILAPQAGVYCRLYNELPDAGIAVCAYSGELADTVEIVPAAALICT